MKKKIILILLLICFLNTVFSQDKKISYADENLNQLSKDVFFSNPLNKFHFFYKVENDSSTLYIKVERQKYGRIKINELNNIRNYLNSISNTKIDTLQTIVIHYYPGQDNCNKPSKIRGTNSKYVYNKKIRINYYDWNNSKYLNLLRKINKKKNTLLFFIYKNDKGLDKYDKKIKWIKDYQGLVEASFFKFHYPCNSSIIIKPNGSFYSERGEHNVLDLLEKI